jgi:dihydrodipicolinate synthase/N-acetylneuraminate lyase
LDETKRESPLRRHKQRLQALALVIMLGVPALLYHAARVGATGWVLALLGVMAATMALLTTIP